MVCTRGIILAAQSSSVPLIQCFSHLIGLLYCAFYDMDTNKGYAWQSDRSIVAIDCTAVENAEADNLY